jgi:hypothetical protein
VRQVLRDGRMMVPPGKMLGGSSGLNHLAYARDDANIDYIGAYPNASGFPGFSHLRTGGDPDAFSR